MLETKKIENAIVVGLVKNRYSRNQLDEYLDELELLAKTAGVETKFRITQERERIDPATFIGIGKVQEIAEIVERDNIDVVLFDDDLTPVQIRNLEKYIKCKILDRSGLILDIFASRAKSKESMTQVELAQLQYLLPRLTRQWSHLSKQYGGVGTKGPGEQQIETDRRVIRARISTLKKKLDAINKEREMQRKGRKDYTRAAIVGYTNVGKSTLLKVLTGANVIVENKLFATLDTTVRKLRLGNNSKILISDTVGFIRKLPTHLIASFRSTLAEASEADILLHVIDISNTHFEEHIQVVNDTLDTLNAAGKPTIYIFNKIDKLTDRSIISEFSKQYQPSVFISANRGINIQALNEELINLLEHNIIEQSLTIKQSDYEIIAKLHDFADIISSQYEEDKIAVRFRIEQKNSERLKKLLGINISNK